MCITQPVLYAAIGPALRQVVEPVNTKHIVCCRQIAGLHNCEVLGHSIRSTPDRNMVQLPQVPHIGASNPWKLYNIDKALLFKYFKNIKKGVDLTVSITNYANELIRRGLSMVGTSSRPRGLAHLPEDEQEAKHLYYGVLQHILTTHFPVKQPSGGKHPACQASVPAAALTVLSRKDLHLGLIHCSLALVCNKGMDGFRQLITVLGTEYCMLSVWDAARWFLDCFTNRTTGCTMDDTQLQLLQDIKHDAEDWRVVVEGSTFYHIFIEGGGSVYLRNDNQLVSEFLTAAMHRLMANVQHTATAVFANKALSLSAEGQQVLINACLTLADNVLVHNLDMLLEVHQAVIAACIIQGISRAHYQIHLEQQLPSCLSFSNMAPVIISTWSVALQSDVFRTVRMRLYHSSTSEDYTATQGPVVEFYNKVFLAACQQAITQSYQEAVLAHVPEVKSEPPTQCVPSGPELQPADINQEPHQSPYAPSREPQPTSHTKRKAPVYAEHYNTASKMGRVATPGCVVKKPVLQPTTSKAVLSRLNKKPRGSSLPR